MPIGRILFASLGCSVILFNFVLVANKTQPYQQLRLRNLKTLPTTIEANASDAYTNIYNEELIPSTSTTTYIQNLTLLWKSYTESNRTEPLFLPNYIPRTQAIGENEITLATHTSASRTKWAPLMTQMEYWRGPISVAMLVNSENDILALQELVQSDRFWGNLTSIHIMIEPADETKLYPHNMLRNLAMDGITSDYFLALDVDFIPPQASHDRLMALLQKNPSIPKAMQAKTLMVLPAFEVFPTKGQEIATLDLLPTSKLHLKKLVHQKGVSPFHLPRFKPGHGPTNFDKWFSPKTTSDSYSIQYQMGFEPYLLGYRPNIPRYWNAFRGFGWNKQSWVLECHMAGYHFTVLTDFYVAHLNHPTNFHQAAYQRSLQLKEQHKQYLKRQYPNATLPKSAVGKLRKANKKGLLKTKRLSLRKQTNNKVKTKGPARAKTRPTLKA